MYTVEFWSRVSGKSEVQDALEALYPKYAAKQAALIRLLEEVQIHGIAAVNNVTIKKLHLKGNILCLELKKVPYRLYGLLGKSKFIPFLLEHKKSMSMAGKTRASIEQITKNILNTYPYEF